jgi:branched-chain amino acid aminotransferase
VMTHALHYGSGVFEGIRAYETKTGPAVFRLEEHLDRFELSAKVYHMEYPFTREQIGAGVKAVVSVNGLKAAYIRPIAFVGYGRLGVMPIGLPVDIAIGAWEWGSYLGEEALTKGVRVALSPWRRIRPDALPVSAKACGQYLSSILGAYVIRANGYHEALFLDDHGHVSEGSGENFFIVSDDVVYTPDSSSSILEGITRDSVMTIARDLGYSVKEKKLVMGDVFAADEAFFTGTAAEVTPIAEVENRPIGDGKPGPVTRAIQDVYFQAVRGEVPRYEKWLTRL